METRIFLGIDGGQSSTLAVVCDETGRLQGVGIAGPSNHLHEPGGPDRLRRALHDSLAAAWADAGLPSSPGVPVELEAAFCGMTGGGEQVAGFLGQVARIGRLGVDHDLASAHAGAFLGEAGAIVIGGTGSAAYGVNPQGQTARAGGWAYLMGDEGSGYDIGRQALVAAARAEDGRGPATWLHAGLLACFGKVDFWDLRRQVYSQGFDRRQVAALAPLVVRAASGGDGVALSILEKAAESLAELALAVLRRLEMLEDAANVAPVGGVFRAGDLILEPFGRKLKAVAPQAAIVPPSVPPALGSTLLALRLAGVRIDSEVKKNLLHGGTRVQKNDGLFK